MKVPRKNWLTLLRRDVTVLMQGQMGSTSNINVIDTHFHLWDLQKWDYLWPTKEEKEIFCNFALSDYDEQRRQASIACGIYVEAHDSIQETRWAIDAFKGEKCCVKGIVGYADTSSAGQLDVELKEFTKEPKFVGVRNILANEQDGWLGSQGVMEGMGVLQKYNLTYDLLMKTENIKDALAVIRGNPRLKFVVDHMAKPNAKTGASMDWFYGMSSIASYSNVHCKLSGMVTEADLTNWKPDDFKLHVDHVLNKFGNERVMFGSDWPVCNLAHASLKNVYDLLDWLLGEIDTADRKKIFETNAIDFYNLRV